MYRAAAEPRHNDFCHNKRHTLSSLALEVGLPTLVSAIIFIGVRLTTKTVPEKVKPRMAALKKTS